MARALRVAFYFKQSSGARPGKGDLLDGSEWKEFPDYPAGGEGLYIPSSPSEESPPERKLNLV
jgi:hypothetical protein